jgi:hypothetical protein
MGILCDDARKPIISNKISYQSANNYLGKKLLMKKESNNYFFWKKVFLKYCFGDIFFL